MQLKLLRLLFILLDRVSSRLAARFAVSVFYSPRRFPAAKWEKAGIAAGRTGKLIFDKEELFTTIWESDGPTVLLIHGWQGRRSQLAKIAADLSKEGYRVVAFDGPAHGSSSKRRTTLVEFAEAVECAAQQFGPIRAIVGHSFGAAAVGIALRKGIKAERVILISCPYSLRHVVSGFAKFIGLPSRSHEKMYPILESLHRCPEAQLSFENIGPDLRMPCLLIHDESDQYIPITDGEQVSRTIDDSKLLRTKGFGHLRILQDDGVVSCISRFICEPTPPLRLFP